MEKTPRRMLHPRRHRRRGIALLLVFAIIITYVIIANHYIYLTISYSRIVANKRDDVLAYWAARGGVTLGRAQLKLDTEYSYDSLNEDWARDVSLDEGDVATGAERSVMIADEAGRFNVLLINYDGRHDGKDEELERPVGDMTSGERLAKAENHDEKLQEMSKAVFQRLVRIVRREDERLRFDEDEQDGWSKANPIVHSMDDVAGSRIFEGIRTYLRKRDGGRNLDASFVKGDRPSRLIKQTPYALLTIEELLLAEEMTPEILFGEQATAERRDKHPAAEDEEKKEKPKQEYDPITGRPLSTREQKEFELDAGRIERERQVMLNRDPLPLADYITLWGDGKVNINTAPREVILALSEHLTWEMVEDIMRARDEAYDRAKLMRDDQAAQPDKNYVPPDASAPPDPNNPNAPKPDEDKRSFRDADIASVVAFYNRIYQNLPTGGADYQPITSPDQLKEEWVKAFDDMYPFLTVRSRYFRVVSSAKVDKISKKLFAVFRRDADTSDQPTDSNRNAAPAPDPSRSGNLPPGSDAAPAEPPVRLTLIYLDDIEE